MKRKFRFDIGSIIFLLIVLLVWMDSAFAQPINPYIDHTCQGDHCAITIHNTPQYILDGSTYKPFTQVTTLTWSGDSFNFSYKEDYWLTIEPYFRWNDNEMTLAEARTFAPGLEYRLDKETYTNNHKFAPRVEGIPPAYNTSSLGFGLRFKDMGGLTGTDFVRDGDTIIIKDKILLDLKDLLGEGYTLTYPNKTHILIGNISENNKGGIVVLDPIFQAAGGDATVTEDAPISQSIYDYNAGIYNRLYHFRSTTNEWWSFIKFDVSAINTLESTVTGAYFNYTMTDHSGLGYGGETFNMTLTHVYTNWTQCGWEVWHEGNGNTIANGSECGPIWSDRPSPGPYIHGHNDSNSWLAVTAAGARSVNASIVMADAWSTGENETTLLLREDPVDGTPPTNYYASTPSKEGTVNYVLQVWYTNNPPSKGPLNITATIDGTATNTFSAVLNDTYHEDTTNGTINTGYYGIQNIAVYAPGTDNTTSNSWNSTYIHQANLTSIAYSNPLNITVKANGTQVLDWYASINGSITHVTGTEYQTGLNGSHNILVWSDGLTSWSYNGWYSNWTLQVNLTQSDSTSIISLVDETNNTGYSFDISCTSNNSLMHTAYINASNSNDTTYTWETNMSSYTINSTDFRDNVTFACQLCSAYACKDSNNLSKSDFDTYLRISVYEPGGMPTSNHQTTNLNLTLPAFSTPTQYYWLSTLANSNIDHFNYTFLTTHTLNKYTDVVTFLNITSATTNYSISFIDAILDITFDESVGWNLTSLDTNPPLYRNGTSSNISIALSTLPTGLHTVRTGLNNTQYYQFDNDGTNIIDTMHIFPLPGGYNTFDVYVKGTDNNAIGGATVRIFMDGNSTDHRDLIDQFITNNYGKTISFSLPLEHEYTITADATGYLNDSVYTQSWDILENTIIITLIQDYEDTIIFSNPVPATYDSAGMFIWAVTDEGLQGVSYNTSYMSEQVPATYSTPAPAYTSIATYSDDPSGENRTYHTLYQDIQDSGKIPIVLLPDIHYDGTNLGNISLSMTFTYEDTSVTKNYIIVYTGRENKLDLSAVLDSTYFAIMLYIIIVITAIALGLNSSNSGMGANIFMIGVVFMTILTGDFKLATFLIGLHVSLRLLYKWRAEE